MDTLVGADTIRKTHQGKCDQQTIFEIIIRSASQTNSWENTRQTLKNVPSSNDIRYQPRKISISEYQGLLSSQVSR